MGNKSDISRRNFLKAAGIAFGAATVGQSRVQGKELQAAEPPGDKGGILLKRKLGRTGLEVTTVSVGTGSGQEPNVLRYGISKGINFIHTSSTYAGGRAIRHVAEAIKGQRDKVFLGLKITWDALDDNAMNKALETLGVDQVDVAFFNIHSVRGMQDEKLKQGAERWKKSGKCRYIGLTTHKQIQGCVKAALDQGFYDVIMPSYNLGMEADMRPLLERAEKANVGVVLMKTQHGLDADAYGNAVAKYLATPGVTTICKTLNTFAAVDGMISDSGKRLDAKLDRTIRDAGRIGLAGRCSMCGVCDDVCPEGIDVADRVRCSDYYLAHSGYYGTAQEVFAGLKPWQGASVCTDCDLCEAACESGVPIRHHLNRVEKLLA